MPVAATHHGIEVHCFYATCLNSYMRLSIGYLQQEILVSKIFRSRPSYQYWIPERPELPRIAISRGVFCLRNSSSSNTWSLDSSMNFWMEGFYLWKTPQLNSLWVLALHWSIYTPKTENHHRYWEIFIRNFSKFSDLILSVKVPSFEGSANWKSLHFYKQQNSGRLKKPKIAKSKVVSSIFKRIFRKSYPFKFFLAFLSQQDSSLLCENSLLDRAVIPFVALTESIVFLFDASEKVSEVSHKWYQVNLPRQFSGIFCNLGTIRQPCCKGKICDRL